MYLSDSLILKYRAFNTNVCRVGLKKHDSPTVLSGILLSYLGECLANIPPVSLFMRTIFLFLAEHTIRCNRYNACNIKIKS